MNVEPWSSPIDHKVGPEVAGPALPKNGTKTDHGAKAKYGIGCFEIIT